VGGGGGGGFDTRVAPKVDFVTVHYRDIVSKSGEGREMKVIPLEQERGSLVQLRL